MKTLRTISVIIISTLMLSFEAIGQENKFEYDINDFLPISNGEIVMHEYYTLAYSEEHEQAIWVFYKLTPEMVNGTAARSNKFMPDPDVSTNSAQLSDYASSGYDRGHLCPAASMSINQNAMNESFYMSNMSPQEPSFNRGGWKKLEEIVRSWANSEKIIYVATGPILNDKSNSIGANQVTVPKHYYKVIYSPKNQKMIGFIMPNVKIEKPLDTYAVSIDSVESMTNIDFFSQLSDDIENSLESNINISLWPLTSTVYIGTDKNDSSVSTRCKGITKSTGLRCKMMTKNSNGYCRYHQDQAN